MAVASSGPIQLAVSARRRSIGLQKLGRDPLTLLSAWMFTALVALRPIQLRRLRTVSSGFSHRAAEAECQAAS